MKFGMMTLSDYYPEDKSEQQYSKDFLAEVDFAEELGFDSVWVGEHHFCNYVCPSPQIVAMAIAQRTKKMRIGTAVALLPHHDPIRLAEDYAMLDLLSGGRLDVGVGRGFIKLIYDGFNQSMVVGAYHCFVDDTPEKARQKWEYHYMRYLHFVGPLIGPPEKIPGKQYDAWKKLGENLRHVTFDQMYPDLVLCGDPSQCIDRIGLLQEELGVSNVLLYMDLGGIAQKELRGSMERFATKVMPHFRSS